MGGRERERGRENLDGDAGLDAELDHHAEAPDGAEHVGQRQRRRHLSDLVVRDDAREEVDGEDDHVPGDERASAEEHKRKVSQIHLCARCEHNDRLVRTRQSTAGEKGLRKRHLLMRRPPL